jgi:DNA-binding MarR family transcriptional regulator
MNYTTSIKDLKQAEDTQKRHNTAITQREAYKAINQSGQRVTEKEIVFNAIREHQPLTSRQLSRKIGIERTNITRSIEDLEEETPPKIKVAKIEKCPITGKRVKWYSLPEWPQTSSFNE